VWKLPVLPKLSLSVKASKKLRLPERIGAFLSGRLKRFNWLKHKGQQAKPELDGENIRKRSKWQNRNVSVMVFKAVQLS